MSPTDLLTETEASDYLGDVPPATLKQWRYRQIGPAYSRIGRHIRYRRSDLDVFVNAGRVEPQGPVEDRYARGGRSVAS